MTERLVGRFARDDAPVDSARLSVLNPRGWAKVDFGLTSRSGNR